MKGMYWLWVAALLMGLGIVMFTNLASGGTEEKPVFAAQETTVPIGQGEK